MQECNAGYAVSYSSGQCVPLLQVLEAIEYQSARSLRNWCYVIGELFALVQYFQDTWQ